MEIINNIKKTIIRATSDELSKAEDDMLEQLSIRQPRELAWFPTKQEAEDWAGDLFFDALTYYLENLGIEIEEIFK